jgi:hypothetical protein
MGFTKSSAASFALAAAALAQPALASTVVPPAPRPFELVNLRMSVDSCAFDPATVSVANTGSSIQVRLIDRQCFAAGTPVEVDVRLGAFPPGTYNVEVGTLVGGDALAVRERLQFTVPPRVEIAIFPPPAHPLTDYTGAWYDPTQPGWGISIHQSPSDTLFAALFEYTSGSPGVPTWTTFQSGTWTSSTTWEGVVYRTTFPPLSVQVAGTVDIDFAAAPPPDVPAGLKWARVRIHPPGGVGGSVMYVTRQRF